MFFKKDHIWIGTASFIVTVLVLFACPNELQLTNDSLQYQSAAQSFFANGSLIDTHGNKLLYWPPLYSILLSLSVPHHLTVFKFIHAFAFGLSTMMFGLLLSNQFVDKKLFYLGLIFISVSIYPLHLGRYLWSEALFTLFFMTLWFLTETYIRTTKKWLFLPLGVVAILLCFQRNAGMFIVFSFFISSIFLLKDRQLGMSFVTSMLLWGAYQLVLKMDGVPIGSNHESTYVAVFNLVFWVAGYIREMFVPFFRVGTWGDVLVVLAGILLMFKMCAKVKIESRTISLIVLMYLSCIIISPAFIAYGSFTDTFRFVAVMFWPAIYLFIMVMNEAIQGVVWKRKVMYGLLAGLIFLNAIRTYHNLARWNSTVPKVSMIEQ